MAQLAVVSGLLDRQIVLQRATKTPGDLGSKVDTWGDLAVVWAQRIDVGGGEQVRADEQAGRISTQFLIRYTWFKPPLNPKDRILYNETGGAPEDGLIFNITRVTPVGGRFNGQLIDALARSDQGA